MKTEAGRYKYVCEDCNEATYFSARERTRASGLRCRFCGSRYLEPSKRSLAKDNIPAFHDIKTEYDARIDMKREGKNL